MAEPVVVEPVKVAPVVEAKADPVVVETKVEPVVEVKAEPETKVEGEKKVEPKVEAKPEPVVEDWRDKRIAQLTAKLREEQAKPKTEAKPDGTVERDLDAEVETRATQRAAMDKFNQDCSDAATKGKAEFPDFQAKVTELTRLVDKADPASVGAYNEFLIAALATGEAPKIIHALGGDLNEASRILNLPPIKRAVELTRLAAKSPEPISDLPKPITTVGGRGAPHTAIEPDDPDRADALPIGTWMARREAQDKANRERRAGR